MLNLNSSPTEKPSSALKLAAKIMSQRTILPKDEPMVTTKIMKDTSHHTIKRQKSQDLMQRKNSKSKYGGQDVKTDASASKLTKMQGQMNKLQQVMHTQISNLKKENELLRKDLFLAKKELGNEKQQMAQQVTRL